MTGPTKHNQVRPGDPHDTRQDQDDNFALAFSKAAELLRGGSSLRVGGEDLMAPRLSFDFETFRQELESVLGKKSTDTPPVVLPSFPFLAGSIIERLSDKPIALEALRALAVLDPEAAPRLIAVTDWGLRHDQDERPGERILPLLKGINEPWSTAKLESLVHECDDLGVALDALEVLEARNHDKAVQALQIAWPALDSGSQQLACTLVFGYHEPVPESFSPFSEEARREFFQKTNPRPFSFSNSEASLGGFLRSEGSLESYRELFRAAAVAGSLFSVGRYNESAPLPDESVDLSVFGNEAHLFRKITENYRADLQNLEPFFEQAERYTREPEPV